MIFVTVGSQVPFDRFISAVDEWAALRGRSDVFAQIGNAKYVPKHMQWTAFLDPSEFTRLMEQAQIVVAHAGMGSILSALEWGKPIVVMPRRAKFHEQRNDHQIATARCFEEQGRVIVAYETPSLAEKIEYALTLQNPQRISPKASPQLITAIRSFLENG